MKTLIILHGWQSSKEKWQSVKKHLESSDLRVIVPDIPGFKPETELKEPWNLDDYIKWFNQFLVEKGIREPFFLLGHSFGGRMSIKFAERFPKALNGLILVSAAGIKKRPLFGAVMKKGAIFLRKIGVEEGAGFWKFLRKVFYRFILRKTDYIRTSGALKKTMSNIVDEDLTLLLDKITVRALILWGKKDKFTPLSDGNLMAKRIKNSEIKVFQKVGHTLHFEMPEILAQTVREFVDKT